MAISVTGRRSANAAAPPAPTELLKMDLSAASLGAITAAKAGPIWGKGSTLYADANWQHQSLVQDAGTGKRWWRWSTAAGTTGEGSANGVSLGIPLASRVSEATYEMRVRFSAGWDPSAGGKMPGLAFTRPGFAATWASGGRDPGADASSARIMWYSSHGGFTSRFAGHLYPKFCFDNYNYHPNDPGAYVTEEHNFWLKDLATDGTTSYFLKMHVKNNTTTSSADGVQESWQDGVASYSDTGLQWTKATDCLISDCFWSIFRGGANGDATWNGASAGFIDFSDVRVTTP